MYCRFLSEKPATDVLVRDTNHSGATGTGTNTGPGDRSRRPAGTGTGTRNRTDYNIVVRPTPKSRIKSVVFNPQKT